MCWPATLAIPWMLTVSETIKPSSVSLQTRMNTSFANNPWYKPRCLVIIASVIFESKGGKMLQYYTLFFKCPGKGFSPFLFPITSESCTSLLSSRSCITVNAPLPGADHMEFPQKPFSGHFWTHRSTQEWLLIVFGGPQKLCKLMQKVKTSHKLVEFLLNLSSIESQNIFATRNSARSNQRDKMLDASPDLFFTQQCKGINLLQNLHLCNILQYLGSKDGSKLTRFPCLFWLCAY